MIDKQTPGIGKGTPGPGRPKGSANKTTALLKDAILMAAEEVGEDGAGKDGLVGYLRQVAKEDVKAFSGLLGKVLPLTINAQIDVEHSTKEQRDAATEAFIRAQEQKRSSAMRLQ